MALSLGFDTSGPWCSAALVRDDTCLALRHQEMAKGQAEHLVPLLQEVMTEAGADWADLTRLGVGIGPGNFTGTRIAVATARGLALSSGVPAIGISLFEAMALAVPRPTLVCLDARRGQVYLQRFGYSDDAPILSRVEDLTVEDDRVTCVGPMAEAVASHLGLSVQPVAQPPGAAIARLALTKDAATAPRPAPLYLRRADAAPPREAPPRVLD